MSWLTTRLAVAGGIVLLLGIIVTLAYCHGRSDEVNGQLEREVEVQASVGAADKRAADRRVKDAVTIQQQEKELAEAILSGEDPATIRARRGCVILRQQGRDTRGIPGCERFTGNGGAAIP